jgi:hypothetical protein
MDRALLPICWFPPEVLAGLALGVEHDRWGQSVPDLRRLALSAPHARTLERFPQHTGRLAGSIAVHLRVGLGDGGIERVELVQAQRAALLGQPGGQRQPARRSSC